VSDEIHILPAEGQSAKEVAEVFTKAAEAQGLDADAIELDGNEVIVPQEVAANLQTNLRSFPPVNQNYTLLEPVKLYEPGSTAAEGDPSGVLGGFALVVNQSA
jgi:hypothetical protein